MTVRDRHFPSVHLRPPCHWVNDPNGLVFHDGAYHVFFQYNPDGVRHANMHWGHWRSGDLVHWQLLPVALAPTPGGEDADGVWSGNAVSAEDRMVAFYSAKRDDRWWQPVASAVSTDGVRFAKSDALSVVEPPAGTAMFRDPYVWRHGNQWRMLVGAALDDGRGAALQYVSVDLNRWDYVGPFLARAPEALTTGGNTEEGWECVQYASLAPDRGALIFSAWDPSDGATGVAVYVGEDHGAEFEPHHLQPFDHGPDLYAPAILPAPDGRWLAWGWILEARDETRVGAPSTWSDQVGWAGMLSLPRELTLAENGLRQAPARETDLLRGRRWFEVEPAVVEHLAPVVLGRVGRAVDVVATVGRSSDGRAAASIRLVTSDDETEYLGVGLDPESGDLVVDRSAASRDPRAKGNAWRIPTQVRPGQSIDIRAVIDHSVIEVFTSTGQALTLRFYPTGDADWRLVVRAAGSGSAPFAVTVWELNPLAITDQRPRCLGARNSPGVFDEHHRRRREPRRPGLAHRSGRPAVPTRWKPRQRRGRAAQAWARGHLDDLLGRQPTG